MSRISGYARLNNISNKHIMHIIESLEFGGAEKVVVHLANMLSEQCRVSICLTKRKGELVKQLNKDIKVHFLDTGEGNSFELPKKITRLLINESVDILHSHDWGVYLESALAVKKAKRPKLIHTVHGHYTNYPPGWRSRIKKFVRHFLEKKASKYTHKIVPVSDSIKNYIIDDIGIPADKISRIHNGIADFEKTENSEINKNKTELPLRLITVGRIAKIKNYPLLINAFSLALKQNSNILLEIVGDGPELAFLKKLTEQLGITEHVQFLGFRTDISERLATNDVFVLSSDYEGISIAILEAMSLSMPVIATNVGGVPETVVHNKTGYLVENKNVEDYTNAIVKLANSSSKREALGKQARLHFEANFHESVVLKQYLALYQSAT